MLDCLAECISIPGLLEDLTYVRTGRVDKTVFVAKWENRIRHEVEVKLTKQYSQVRS